MDRFDDCEWYKIKKVKERKKEKQHTQFSKSLRMESRNFQLAMEVCVVRDVERDDLHLNQLQVDHHLYDGKMKDLEGWKDLYPGERNLVVVF